MLKEVAKRRGIDVSRLDNRGNHTQRIRRRKKKLVGGEISTPCLPTVQKIMEDKQQLIESGELLLGEPCTPYTATKSTVTSTGEIKFETIQIYGRKIPLHDLRKVLLAKHEKCTRHLALWHDHSTILHTGYILFAVWILYDRKVFMTEEYVSLSGQQISNLQEIIEEPVIYDCSQFIFSRIADSTSSRSSRMPY